HGSGGEEARGCGTVSIRGHGTEDRGWGRLPRARRGTRRDHGSCSPRRGGRRKGGDAPRPQVSRRVFSADRVRGASMAKVPKRWFEDFFGADYLVRYVHPETDARVEAIDKMLHLRKGSRILDGACGSGRHTTGLAKRGYRRRGCDLSRVLLAR